MSIVDFTDLKKHASDVGYSLAMANINSLPIAKGAIQASAELNAPLVLTVYGDDLTLQLLPSVELLARQAKTPLAILAKQIKNNEQAILAIRLGCNGLVPADGLSESDNNNICNIATSTGIPIIDHQELSELLNDIDDELEATTLSALTNAPSSWKNVDAQVTHIALEKIKTLIQKLGASEKGSDALNRCKTWDSVEHLIIYNTTVDDTRSAELAAKGRRVLDKIPGVRATWSGQAVKEDADYRWCWLIRFAHPTVIDSYREHPDHIAYADTHFRPLAGDRISIDYKLISADEK